MRQWACSPFLLPILGILLSCFIPSVSSADLSSKEKRLTIPTPDLASEASQYTIKSQLPIRSMLTQSGWRACSSVDDQREKQPNGDKSAVLAPLKMACINLIRDDHETGWSGYEAKGDHARSNGNWSDAVIAYAKAVELLGRTTAQEGDLDMASLLNKLGAMHSKQHDIAGAEIDHRRALTIYTTIQGGEDLRVADTLDLLAVALMEVPANLGLIGPLFFRAWAIRETVLGPEHPAVADSLHRLALTLYADNLSMAIPLFLRSIEIRKRVFGSYDLSVADSLSAMALLYEVHQRRDLAIPLYQEALTIRERVFGPNSSETFGNMPQLRQSPAIGPP